ncbi:MAG TPA: DUF2029 domain-containing protein [Saprospiraceae bacterium]|nr:DUF2029 domain-containing protein [Saprospiraceae bacterium]
MSKLQEILKNPTYIALVNSTIVLIVAAQQYFLHSYNTFTVYQYSVYHFFQKLPLYDAYPQYAGYFVYNPTFALLFLPYAYLPTPIGILAWVMTLMMAFYYGLRLLPIQRDKMVFVYFFSLISLVTALQNLDTAPMVAACIFAAFVYAERKDYFRATFFPNVGFFVKGYVAIGACFLMMRKFKRRVFPYVFFWFSLFLLLPLVRYTPNELYQLYQDWGTSYANDRISQVGVSFMGILRHLFHLPVHVLHVQILAGILLILTMVVMSLRKKYAKEKFHFLSYILIFVVIFNHLANTSTYIIAVPGVAIWYLVSERTWIDKFLLGMTFLLTILSPTDLFPLFIRNRFIYPYSLQALGPILVFILLQYELLSGRLTPFLGKRI